MTDYDVGVNTSATYSVKRVDSDYFDETGVV
jgi:restriction endonuclease Mrr